MQYRMAAFLFPVALSFLETSSLPTACAAPSASLLISELVCYDPSHSELLFG